MESFSKYSISVVIPVYNEEEIIEQCIINTFNSLSNLFLDYELIIVNDGSLDQTPQILSNLSELYSQLHIITNAKNLGIGKSLLKGLKFAKKEYIIHNGADCPFNFNGLCKLLPYLTSHDIIVVARNNHTGYTFYRKVVSFINKSLLRILFPLKLNDYNFVQIYKKEVIDNVTPNARSAGFLIPEILIRAYTSNYKIVEIKSDYQARTTGKASAGKLSILLYSFSDMIKYFTQLKLKV